MKYSFLPFKNKLNKSIYILMMFMLSALVVIYFNSIYATHCVEAYIKINSDGAIPFVVKGASITNTSDTDFSTVKVSTIKQIQLSNGMNLVKFELPVPALTKLRYFQFEFDRLDDELNHDEKKIISKPSESIKTVNLRVESVSLLGMNETSLSNINISIEKKQKASDINIFEQNVYKSNYISLQGKDTFSISNSKKIQIKPILFYKVNFIVLILFSIFVYSVLFLFFRVLLSERNRKHVKTPDLVMMVLLIFVLIMPLLEINYSQDLDRTENRVLAKQPSFITSEKKMNLNFGSELDSYFNDRFGMRHFFIKIKDFIFSYNRVGVAPSAEGKIYGVDDNWYFVDGLLQLKADNDLLRKEKQNLIKVSEHYNCPVYVLIYPFKSSIYHEAVSSIYKNPNLVLLNESDKIANYFNDGNFENLKAIDLTPLFLKSKEDYPDRLLYYKDDHHQTEWAAYLAAKSFASSVGGLPFDSIKDPGFDKHLGYMDIYSIEPLFMRGISYQRIAIRSKAQLTKLKDSYYYLSTTAEYKKKVKHTQKRFRVYDYENSSPLVDKIVLTVGNSYVANTGRMLAYFTKSTWQYNFYAGKIIETSLYDVDKDLNGKKIDYVVVSYFTNAVMSEIVKK